jgi:N utilization substance protein B
MAGPFVRSTTSGRSTRHRAREAALQILYLWEVGGTDVVQAAETFFGEQWPGDRGAPEALRTFATDLACQTVMALPAIDPLIAETAEHWRPERMAVLDRLILRLGVGELLQSKDTPAPVIINEALELARTFSDDDAVRFINGMLDGVRKRLAERG